MLEAFLEQAKLNINISKGGLTIVSSVGSERSLDCHNSFYPSAFHSMVLLDSQTSTDNGL